MRAPPLVGPWLVKVARQRRRAPSLVHDILGVQLAITAAVGLLALASMSWTSRTFIDNNLAHWAAQWSAQLGELGAPFYLPDESAALLSVERFMATYPEIAYVNWYRADGARLFSLAQDGVTVAAPAPLARAEVASLERMAGVDSPHVLEAAEETGHFRLRGPIWTESISSDGLIGFGTGDATPAALHVLGFIEVGLDFSWYHEQMMSRLAIGSLLLLGVLALSWLASHRFLKRALLPLSALQTPLSELAKGNMLVRFAPSQHREIQSIVTTLEETTAALDQRDRRLVRLATHDTLTGLYNRHRFVEELAAEIEANPPDAAQSAVLFIDLDQFKYINDTCGHPAGDEFLRLAARCLRSAARPEDVVGRFGGDEFTVLARNVTRSQARALGHAILAQMRMLTQVHDSNVFHLQCSVGIAMVRPGLLDPHEYLAQADIACHAAKTRGRNRVELYKVSEREARHMAKEVRWVQTVREALKQGSFVLHYQPLVSVCTGWAQHYEALLRLEAPNGQIIPPDAFLPTAERFGLVVDIDHWVVEHAIRALAKFRAERPELKFSVNLSAAVLEDERFADHVTALLRDHSVPPQAVVFEITEQIAVRFAAQVDRQLVRLRELGCGFAVDEFGKGYSSFGYLKHLPVDYLKMDGSFIETLDRDPIDQIMVRMIGELGRAAGIKTVAERVKNAATLELLAKFGIDYAQGYYLGRPAKAPEDRQFPVAGAVQRPRVARRA